MARSSAPYRCRMGVCLLLSGAALACADSSPSGPGEPEPGPPVLALSAASADFTGFVGAPAPAARTVNVINQGEGALSGLSAVIAYAPGQPTGWLTAALSGTTAPATLTLTTSTVAMAPGAYGATVTVAGSAGGTRTLNATLAVGAGTAPSIVITSPARAAMLMQGSSDDSPVQISGRVCHDAAPIVSLAVNGAAVSVSGSALCEDFDVTQSSAWGMSTITVEAVNAWGRRAEHVQAYLRSPAFQLVKAVPDSIPSGVFVQLNQPALDDDDPDLDDLASMLAAAMPTAAQVYAALPTVLYTRDVLEGQVPFCTDQLTVRKTSLSWGAPLFYVTASALNLNAAIRAASVSIGASVSYTGCFGATTTAGGTATAGGLVLAGTAAMSNGALLPNMVFQVEHENPSLNINASGFISAVASLLSSDIVVQEMLRLFRGHINALVTDLLNPQLDQFITDIGLTEVPVHVNGRELSVQGSLGQARTGAGYLGVAVASRFAPAAASGSEPPHGSILFSSSAVPVLSASAFELGTGVAIDAINQFLSSAWRAGAFDVTDLAAEVGNAAPGITGTAAPLLPPVLLPSGTGNAVDIGFGELRITGHVEPTAVGLPAGAAIPITAHASAQLGVVVNWSGVGLETGTISPVVHVQVDVPDDIIDESGITALVRSAAERVFQNMISDAIAALPLVSVPIMRLDNVTVGRDGSWLTLTGDAVAR